MLQAKSRKSAKENLSKMIKEKKNDSIKELSKLNLNWYS
jgi:hypothetical protein